jgi:hypothetical protein
MNERLESFRKRLRGPDKQKGDWKVGSPTAWLALLLSLTTTYLNLRRHDDFKVIITNVTFELKDDQTAYGKLSNTFVATFINGGNRPVSVLSAKAAIGQFFDEKRNCDQVPQYQSVKLEIKPFVVKPGEIGIEPVTTKGSDSTIAYIENYSRLDTAAGHKALLCLQFTVVTPDAQVESEFFPFLLIGSTREAGTYDRKDDEKVPVRILPR